MNAQPPIWTSAASTEPGWETLMQTNLASRASAQTVLDPYRTQSLDRRFLRNLILARLTMIGCGLVVVVIFDFEMGRHFPLIEVSLSLLAVGLLSLLGRWRLMQRTAITQNEFMLQLIGDIAVLTYAIAMSGGDDNPFSDLFVIPLVLAAYALEWRRLAIVVAFGLAGWYSIHIFFRAMPPFPHSADLLAHLLIASLATYFAYSIAKVSRTHERTIARGREDALVQRNAKAIQTVAAQAADAISSPLATMAVLLNEIRQDRLSPAEHREALDTLAKQVQVCKDNMSRLLNSVGQARGDDARSMTVDALLQWACDECQLMDPMASISLDLSGTMPAPLIAVERSLFDAIVLLMQDCATEAPHTVTVGADWDSSQLTIRMVGAGSWPISHIHFTGSRPEQATQTPSLSQESLTLAATLIARFDGTIKYRPGNADKWLQISLPLSKLRT